jgi:hypothetical protein
MTKFQDSTSVKSYLEIYNNLVILRRDLYYKDIIQSHKDVLVRKTTELIEDIFYQYKKNWINKNDMFSAVEDLRCKNHIIDQVVYEKITYARKTFCRPKSRTTNRK